MANLTSSLGILGPLRTRKVNNGEPRGGGAGEVFGVRPFRYPDDLDRENAMTST